MPFCPGLVFGACRDLGRQVCVMRFFELWSVWVPKPGLSGACNAFVDLWPVWGVIRKKQILRFFALAPDGTEL